MSVGSGPGLSVVTSLAPSVASAGQAREFARDTVSRWQVGPAADDVVFVVHELVTNAVVHGTGPINLSLTCDGDVVHVDVSDGSARLPVRRRASQTRSGGRGIALVSAIALAWGTSPHGSDGKSVWADIAVAGSTFR
jgi:anti-sigma regulatory factor (Ser/Thr protein kinase)